jgi:hypothetical protein
MLYLGLVRGFHPVVESAGCFIRFGERTSEIAEEMAFVLGLVSMFDSVEGPEEREQAFFNARAFACSVGGIDLGELVEISCFRGCQEEGGEKALIGQPIL